MSQSVERDYVYVISDILTKSEERERERERDLEIIENILVIRIYNPY